MDTQRGQMNFEGKTKACARGAHDVCQTPVITCSCVCHVIADEADVKAQQDADDFGWMDEDSYWQGRG